MTRVCPEISTKRRIIIPMVIIVQPGFLIVVLARIYSDAKPP